MLIERITMVDDLIEENKILKIKLAVKDGLHRGTDNIQNCYFFFRWGLINHKYGYRERFVTPEIESKARKNRQRLTPEWWGSVMTWAWREMTKEDKASVKADFEAWKKSAGITRNIVGRTPGLKVEKPKVKRDRSHWDWVTEKSEESEQWRADVAEKAIRRAENIRALKS